MKRAIYLISLISPIFLLVAGVVFRTTMYWHIPVAVGEPKGGGDILEVLIFIALLCVSALAITVSIAFAAIPSIRNKNYSIKLFTVGFVAPVAYWFLHPLLTRSY